MSAVILPPEWNARENEITPESVYQSRREFLKTMGIAGLGIAGALYAGPAFAGGGVWLTSKSSSSIWRLRRLRVAGMACDTT